MAASHRMFLLLLGYLAFVVYGSLVPLDLRPMPLDAALERFAHIPFLRLGVESRADWIANGVLYLPLGALLVAWLRQCSWPSLLAVPAALVAGGAVAVGVEFAQLYFPPRTVSLNDLIAEGIGLTTGALLAPLLLRRRRVLHVPLRAGREWLAAHGLGVYAALYLAYSLFPYDFVVSGAELRGKLASDLWGWWLAGSGRRPLITVMLLAAEAALAAPLGAGLWRWCRPGRRLNMGAAVAAGVLLGVVVEGLQLLIANGTSQGGSVLARAAGVAAGAWWWPRRERWGLAGVRRAVAAHAALLAAAYVLLLLAVNGWFTHGWQGADAAAAKWGPLRLLPFYYHYYTTEAQALVSLSSVVAMYLPVGLLAWARGVGAAGAGTSAAVLALVVEVAKLFQQGQRPDPTNVLIAAAAAAGVVALLAWAQHSHPVPPAGRHAPTAGAAPARGRDAAPASIAWLAVPAALLGWYLWSAPAGAWLSAALVVACAAAVWWRPVAAVLVVPALLPALDVAVWTGRLHWDEFDLLLAVCLAVGLTRVPAAPRRRTDGPWLLLFAVLALSVGLGALRGLLGTTGVGSEALAGYHGAFNGLRIAKGVLWAGLFVALARRLDAAGLRPWPMFRAGMALGLAWVVAVMLWERAVFVGLFDFDDEYRVTGPFSAMHRGGAYVECYLALAVPFVASLLLEARRWAVRAAAAVLLAAAAYAMFVTYSRNGYAALAVAVAVWTVFALRAGIAGGAGGRAPLAALLAVPVLVLAAAVPVLSGSQAQERLAQWQRDLGVRQAHWADALALRDPGVASALVGMGVGTFPALHYWRSAEPVRAATFRVDEDAGRVFLRMGGGALTYLDQWLGPTPLAEGSAQLVLELRSSQPAARLAASVCEKWMLTSRRCVDVALRGDEAAGRWTQASAVLDLSALQRRDGALPRSVKFALHSPPDGVVVDVARVRLVSAAGEDMLANGDFARGLDRWLFSTNADPPYHIHSLPVAVLFDQGWLGVVAWALLLAAALARGAALAWQGSTSAAVAVAAVLAFLASGTLNTLIDDPRFLWLLLVATWWCCAAPAADRAVKAAAQ
jgi:VanZ family protein